MSEAFIGEIRLVGFTYAPQGWLFCDGSLVPISNYEALFSLISTTYGGDGQTTFALPDLRGRTPIHQGAGPGLSNRVIGGIGGAERVTLTAQQLPAHRHDVLAVAGGTPVSSPQAARLASGGLNVYTNAAQTTSMSASALASTGGNQPHENRQPSLVLNFIIAYEGIYPTRP
ncbi:MAG: phage tail protein [Casimicrobium sp.]